MVRETEDIVGQFAVVDSCAFDENPQRRIVGLGESIAQ